MPKGNKKNNRTKSFLLNLEQDSLTSKTNKLTEKCKFNFAYLTKQEHNQDFS